MDFVNKQAFKGTLLAHNDGGVPNMVLNVPELITILLWTNGLLL